MRRATSQAHKHLAKNPERTSAEFAAAYFPNGQAETAVRVHQVFLAVAPLDVRCVHPDDRLVADLRLDDLDSMAFVEFTLALEKEFGVNLPETEMARARTLRDIVEYIAMHSPPRT
jgi:acyl carrier protein